jgi:hypothetical protein
MNLYSSRASQRESEAFLYVRQYALGLFEHGPLPRALGLMCRELTAPTRLRSAEA